MKKRFFCALLVALLSFSIFTGCGNGDGTPRGMYSATVDGDPFILYVPDEWTDNRDSGLSSAHYGLNVIATARYYTPEDANFTLSSYVDAYVASLEENDPEISFSRKDAKLGKEASAIRLEYDFEHTGADKDGKDVVSTAKAIHYFALNEDKVVMLSFYCESKAFDEYAEVFEQIRSEFVLRPMPNAPEAVTDKKTPEGMKLASGDIEYKFYVPNAWVADLSDNLSLAYYPESSRPNVSVTSYSPNESMDAKKYFELCEEEYKKSIEGYKFITSSERTVDGKNAISYTYEATYGDVEIRIMQTVFVSNDLVYSITYTAHKDRFEEHIDDVNAMLDAFRFR